MRLRFDDLSVMARTVFGEAQGELHEGRLAVAHVILNRARAGDWWGRGISEVCLKRWQFYCWNPGDPNRPRLFQVDLDDRDLLGCTRACIEALTGVPDPTAGATHYHALDLPMPPRWARGRMPDVVIGRHAFFRNIG
ncbi:MAG: cell wall hydrolase [Rhodospirillales bacterium]|nr:cell wall hydrolase [Rhodospirillales bacterium]